MLTQEEIAQLTGTSRETVSRVLSDSAEKAGCVFAVAKVLNTDLQIADHILRNAARCHSSARAGMALLDLKTN